MGGTPKKNNPISTTQSSNDVKSTPATDMTLAVRALPDAKAEGNDQELGEIMPDLWSGEEHPVLQKLIWDYALDAKLLERPFNFFRRSSLEEQILALVYYAAPLDHVEKFIRMANARKEKHLSATLTKSIIIAIENVDVTLLDEFKRKNEGMMERLVKLRGEFFKDTDSKWLVEIKKALPPLEDKEIKTAREEVNYHITRDVFDAFVMNDPKIDEQIRNFNRFLKSTTHLNRMHLAFVAAEILCDRGGELPKINDKDFSGWYGKLGDKFCLEIIQPSIESPRIRQLLSLDRVFPYLRQLDVESSDEKLGIVCSVHGARSRKDRNGLTRIQTYYQNLHQRFMQIRILVDEQPQKNLKM